ncbi:hypothetical protein GWI33_018475 [Rhynchophorus ferrugineus]|uniref:Uncharacterized protein n=1 Tax=Rhynchophorus ferrugineus TaxID=354439 RepID=A0A834HWA5_RHYFE|nr:hypothetical protein GWI33_018475 [Rhynchophorus ferrugineus]
MSWHLTTTHVATATRQCLSYRVSFIDTSGAFSTPLSTLPELSPHVRAIKCICPSIFSADIWSKFSANGRR